MNNKRRRKLNNGKKYEQKVSKMVKKMYPYAVISDDVKLPATITGGKRQIDTLLDLGLHKIDFDAKDHKRNIGIDDIAAYDFKLRDEGVQFGVMVSNSPYAQSALSAATHLGIKPTHLIDTTDGENPFSIASSTLIEVRYVKSLGFGVKHSSVGQPFSVFQDLGRQELIADDGVKTSTAYELFKELWNDGFFVEKNAEFNEGEDGGYRYTLKDQAIVMASGEHGIINEFSFDYEIGTEYLEGSWNIEHAQGLFDAAKGVFETNQDITSEPLTLEEIADWPRIEPSKVDKSKYGIRIMTIGELPEEKSE